MLNVTPQPSVRTMRSSVICAMLCGIGILSQHTAFAAVTLTTPEEVVIVALDDQEVRSGLLRNAKSNYQLDAGNHSISVKYEQIFYHPSGEHDVLRSNVVTLNNVTLQDGMQYRLGLVNEPKNFEQGEKFAQQPTIGLFNSQGQLVAQQTGVNSQPKSWFGSRLLGSRYDLRQPSTRTSSKDTQAVQDSILTTDHNTTSVSTNQTTSVSTNAVDQQLIELWKKASPQERQKFTAWLGGQVAQ